jgi:hypothetical protein
MTIKISEPYSIGSDESDVVDVSFDIDDVTFSAQAFTDSLKAVKRAAAKGAASSMLLRVMQQINEVANETDVRWEARIYQIKVWSEKALKIAKEQ